MMVSLVIAALVCGVVFFGIAFYACHQKFPSYAVVYSMVVSIICFVVAVLAMQEL